MAEEAEEDGRRSGRDTETKTRTHTKMWGKNLPLGTLQQFGDETEHFCGICWNLWPVGTLDRENLYSHVLEAFCEHFVNMLELNVRTSHFRWLVLKLFKVGLGLLRVGLGVI